MLVCGVRSWSVSEAGVRPVRWGAANRLEMGVTGGIPAEAVLLVSQRSALQLHLPYLEEILSLPALSPALILVHLPMKTNNNNLCNV